MFADVAQRVCRAARDAAGEADRIVVFGSFLHRGRRHCAATAATVQDLTMADPDDVNVDDLRRRARRRLVGAIVLALAVAVFVPMLLESDPKPLGEDVSVKIPPVDDGKFVNRLNETSKTEPPKRRAEGERAEPRSRSAEGRAAESRSPKVEAPAKEERAEGGAVAKAEPAKSRAAPDRTLRRRPRRHAAVAGDAAPARASRRPASFSVQVSAFSDDKGANSLVNKLKKAGYPAYTRAAHHEQGHAVARARRALSVARKRGVGARQAQGRGLQRDRRGGQVSVRPWPRPR